MFRGQHRGAEQQGAEPASGDEEVGSVRDAPADPEADPHQGCGVDQEDSKMQAHGAVLRGLGAFARNVLPGVGAGEAARIVRVARAIPGGYSGVGADRPAAGHLVLLDPCRKHIVRRDPVLDPTLEPR